VPVHLDAPKIDETWRDIPELHAPLGEHGIGGISVTSVGAAVASAIFNATGKRVRKLPLSLDKLLYEPASWRGAGHRKSTLPLGWHRTARNLGSWRRP
jgi:CO/xanthine dehydrogenase Mo-binding subunit